MQQSPTLRNTNLKTSLIGIVITAVVTVGCGFRTISEVEWAECKSLASQGKGSDYLLRVLLYSEKKAFEITSGKRSAGREETAKAKEFVADLKIVNDDLPADQKFLKANGRPIYVVSSTPQQREGILNVLLGKQATLTQNQKVQEASRRLAAAMSELREDLDVSRSPNQTEGDYGR